MDPSAADVPITNEPPSKRGRKAGSVVSLNYKTGIYCQKCKRSDQTCNHCGCEIKATKALKRELLHHLANQCKLASDAVRQVANEELASTQSEPVAPTATRSQLTAESKAKQSGIAQHFNSVAFSLKLSQEVTSELNTKQLRWAIASNIPFSAFDDPFFLDWINSVRPQYRTAGEKHDQHSSCSVHLFYCSL